MSDIDPQINQAMTDLGIDQNAFDDGSLEVESIIEEAQKGEAAAPNEEAKEGEEVGEIDENGEVIQKTEGEEKNEASIEGPKLTAKEFQEIEQAKQAFETEKNSFMEERKKIETEFKAQYEDKLNDYNQFDEFLNYYATKDPEMFKLLQDDFAEFGKQYAHPIVDKVSKEVAELRKELSQFKSKASDEVTLTKLDAEVNEFKAGLGKEAELSGIKIDYKQAEEAWAKMPGIPFKNAVLSIYGESLIKAAASKAKVAQAEKKVQAQPKVATTGSLNRSSQSTPFNHKTSSWDESVKQALKEVLGSR